MFFQSGERMKVLLSLAAFWLLLTTTSLADIFVTQNRPEFLARLVGIVYAEGFEEFQLGQPILAPQSFTDSSSKFQYAVNPIAGDPIGGLFSVGQQSDKWLSTQLERSVRFDFSKTLPTAVGGDFFFTNASGVDTGDLGSTMMFTLNGTSQFTLPANLKSTNSFIGFISTTPISSLVVSRNSNPANAVSYITANNIAVGIAAVPEPNSLLLLVATVIAFCAGRRAICDGCRCRAENVGRSTSVQ